MGDKEIGSIKISDLLEEGIIETGGKSKAGMKTKADYGWNELHYMEGKDKLTTACLKRLSLKSENIVMQKMGHLSKYFNEM